MIPQLFQDRKLLNNPFQHSHVIHSLVVCQRTNKTPLHNLTHLNHVETRPDSPTSNYSLASAPPVERGGGYTYLLRQGHVNKVNLDGQDNKVQTKQSSRTHLT